MTSHGKIIFSLRYLALAALLGLGMTTAARAASAPTKVDSLDELHEKAKKEGGKLNLYASLSANSIEVILPAFMKRFPGITVDHTDATGDKLIARIVAEGRGGRVIADAFGASLGYTSQMTEQKLFDPLAIPEAAAYPAHLKTDFWIATDAQFFIIGANTNLVKKGEEPKGFEDLANPKWKGLLMGEPRDYPLLLGLAKAKYKSDDKAIDLVKRIALNQVEFHRGHSQLIEFLVAGQRPDCGVVEVTVNAALLAGAATPLAAALSSLAPTAKAAATIVAPISGIRSRTAMITASAS